MLTTEQLDAIRQFDTCTVLNAIETFGVRLRSHGFARPGLRWLCPSIPVILGYACTLHVKSANPPMRGSMYQERNGWWRYVGSSDGPRLAVVQDMDESAGLGSVAGQVHSAIMQSLGCQGLVTNGSVRDIAAVDSLGFALLAGSVTPSHAYGHVVSFGEPVVICGLNIAAGDLLMADRYGLISIPAEIGAQIPAAARQLVERDNHIVRYCQSPGFSIEGLESVVDDVPGETP